MTREPLERKALEYIENQFGEATVKYWREKARRSYIHNTDSPHTIEEYENNYILEQYCRLHSKEKTRHD